MDFPAQNLLTYNTLRASGLSHQQIRLLCQNGTLVRVRKGIYVDQQRWEALQHWDRDVLRVYAHHAVSNGIAHYSHVSAARIWQLSLWNAPAVIHVAHTGRRGERGQRGNVMRHNQVVPPSQTTMVDGLPVTTLARTVIDCARMLPFEQALVIADSAAHRGMDVHSLGQLVREGAGTRNINRVRAVLDAIDQRMESAGETRLRIRLHEWGYSSVQPQYAIKTPGGLFRADFALPELKLIIEFDGKGKYGDNTTAREVLLAERRRESLLIEDGWLFVRVRWEDFDDDASLRGRIRSAVARARLASRSEQPRSPLMAEVTPHAG